MIGSVGGGTHEPNLSDTYRRDVPTVGKELTEVILRHRRLQVTDVNLETASTSKGHVN